MISLFFQPGRRDCILNDFLLLQSNAKSLCLLFKNPFFLTFIEKSIRANNFYT